MLERQSSFIQRSARALVLGIPGVVALPFMIEAPAGVPAAALAIGPAILLFAAALAGAWASVRIGIQSRLILHSRLDHRDILFGTAAGILAGIAVAMIDQATVLYWRGEAIRPLSVIENLSPRQFAIGVFYGGLTEEIVFRWGIGSIVAALALLTLPKSLAIPLSIVVAAALFSVAHLPAAFADAETWHAGAIIRTLSWNALLGLLFGTLFFRKSLEVAILAHVGFHFGTAIALVF
jgi:hypothetical protein